MSDVVSLQSLAFLDFLLELNKPVLLELMETNSDTFYTLLAYYICTLNIDFMYFNYILHFHVHLFGLRSVQFFIQSNYSHDLFMTQHDREHFIKYNIERMLHGS